MSFLIILAMVATCVTLLYRGRPYLGWVVPVGIGLAAWMMSGAAYPVLFVPCVALYGAAAVVFGIPSLRQGLVTGHVMRWVSGMLPRISETERVALEAGTVWWDGDLFSGRPDWDKLAAFHPQPLTDRERRFVEGPTRELCALLDDFAITRAGDLPPEVWDFLKRHRFLGMIIPETYGGLGFSAAAHSAVITMLSSRSVAASVTAMVPNSLGPAELLLHYGTEDQKQHFLPRLARGEEIPCFALTEPGAGSDAASGTSHGVVCRETRDGREVLGIRLNWDKRYITLSPVATIIGLSFRLRDPEGLLGGPEDLGITVALVPANLPGVETGQRHDPLHTPFLNGPTRGHDVFVPVDAIIGGPSMAGQGWRMLMESLAAGRSISLPALATGGTEAALRVTGAYASVREQFKLPIGRFEGIQERLARIAGLTYFTGAARVLTAGAVDAGEKPAVISAVVKAWLTESNRLATNDAMDILGGAGISRGPRNTLANGYMALPIGITVEGANILTRSLIVFGQGAIRCHPFVLREIHAVTKRDLAGFDAAFFGHVGFVYTNGVRSWLLGLTGGRLARPALGGPLQAYFGELSRFSAAFTVMSDVAMLVLGARLKRMEMLSGRMAEAFAWLYLTSAALKRFVDEGHSETDLPAARWACEYGLFQVQQSLAGVIDNFPNRAVRLKLRAIVFPLGARRRPPSDALSGEVAQALLFGGSLWERLTSDIFVPDAADPGLGRLEAALACVVAARPVLAKLAALVKSGRVQPGPRAVMVDAALEAGLISEPEAELVRAADAARDDAIQVDDFPPAYFARDAALNQTDELSGRESA